MGDARDEHGFRGGSGGKRLVKAAPFSYHAPSSVDEASRSSANSATRPKSSPAARALVPMMALRLARFDHLVDLSGIEQLRGVQHAKRQSRRSVP